MQKKTMKVLMKTKRKLSKKSTKTKNALVQFNENSSILRTMQRKVFASLSLNVYTWFPPKFKKYKILY